MNAEAFGIKLKNGSIIPAELCQPAFQREGSENLASKVVSPSRYNRYFLISM